MNNSVVLCNFSTTLLDIEEKNKLKFNARMTNVRNEHERVYSELGFRPSLFSEWDFRSDCTII